MRQSPGGQRAPRVSTVPVTRFIMDVTALMGIL